MQYGFDTRYQGDTMTAAAALVKKAPFGNQVSVREPDDTARPAAGCPTRVLLDRIGDDGGVRVGA